MMAIVARPEDIWVAADRTLQRHAAEGIDLTVIVAAHGSTNQPQLQGVHELVLLSSLDEDRQRSVCELVDHLRRLRPQVVLTHGPDQGDERGKLGHLATTAVLLAADVRFGHTCTTRGPHTVSKLYYLMTTGAWSWVLSTVQPGATDDGNHDVFAGQRQPAPTLTQSA
jgi:LmbE family N-acetylglucosaminyl deacetylase